MEVTIEDHNPHPIRSIILDVKEVSPVPFWDPFVVVPHWGHHLFVVSVNIAQRIIIRTTCTEAASISTTEN